MSAHPGHITFVDEAGEQVLPVAQVPAAVAFVTVDGQVRPVVRVVAVTQGERRELRSYGVDGALLQSTFQQRR